MPLQCNIDARGKLVRMIYGVGLVLIGIAALFSWAIPIGGWIAWVVTALLIGGGGFAIFEARAGWCVVRAMGFKTPV